MNTVTRSIAATAVLALAACGGDSTGPDVGNTGDELSSQVSQEIASAIFLQALQFGETSAMADGVSSLRLTGATLALETVDIDYSGTCDTNDGTISVTGNITDDTDSNHYGTVAANFVLEQENCDTPTSQGVFQVGTLPTIEIDLAVETSASSFAVGMAMDGGFEFSSPDATGTCSINLDWDISRTRDGSSQAGSVTGSVCGHQIDESM